MSTTRSTSEQVGPYTVVTGGRTDRPTEGSSLLSAVVLGREAKFNRPAVIRTLERHGVAEIVAVEPAASAYEVESLTRSLPTVRFLLLQRPFSVGEQINAAMGELRTRYVLVIWDDTLVEALPTGLDDLFAPEGVIALVPEVRGPNREEVPTVVAPASQGPRMRVLTLPRERDGQQTLYPADFAGIYHRERFLDAEGYDADIPQSYWQKLDFGFRLHMIGYTVAHPPGFRVALRNPPVPEDTTPGESYLRFFLKNLGVSVQNGRARLRRRSLWTLLLKTGTFSMTTLRLHREVKRWLSERRYLFQRDAHDVIRTWGTRGERQS